MRRAPAGSLPALGLLTLALAVPALGQEGESFEEPHPSRFRVELKTHFRSSDEVAFPVPFPFAPEQLPPGQPVGLLRTVDPGDHWEVSTLTLEWGGDWRPWLSSNLKVDLRDLHDRNPTSTDDEWDVDEAWIRFGREAEPAVLPERGGIYGKLGKFAAFERQDDRHLESYGVVSTAFNRMEDIGVELGLDLGRHLYLKGSFTHGNPVFMRDPNALAGDNGTPIFMTPFPDPELRSGVPILYDADVAIDEASFDHPEVGFGLGIRFADELATHGFELLTFARRRDLAETVELEGTFYGGDLDLLRGPFNLFPYPITDEEKEEVGANLWVYAGGFSLFAQYVDQDLAGLPRTGAEMELAWRFDLPLFAGVRGRQLFPTIAPAIRYSQLDPGFRPPAVTPSPSFAWDWTKIDAGLRLGIVGRTDLTIEYATNTVTLVSGREVDYDELLATLRLRYGG
ncbi:MAG: hypothetical protein R2991_07710 [Thermoanaerobaculia bacterium]